MYLEEGAQIEATETTSMHSAIHLTTISGYDRGKKYTRLANCNLKKKKQQQKLKAHRMKIYRASFHKDRTRSGHLNTEGLFMNTHLPQYLDLI